MQNNGPCGRRCGLSLSLDANPISSVCGAVVLDDGPAGVSRVGKHRLASEEPIRHTVPVGAIAANEIGGSAGIRNNDFVDMSAAALIGHGLIESRWTRTSALRRNPLRSELIFAAPRPGYLPYPRSNDRN